MLYYRYDNDNKKGKSIRHRGIIIISAAVVFCISASSVFGDKKSLTAPDDSETVTVFNYSLDDVQPSEVQPESTSPDEEDTPISFAEPAQGVLTSPFGSRWGRNHNGIDIGGDSGSDIYAAADGTVSYSDWMGGYGNYIIIDHKDGMQTAYGHCSKLLVSSGETVKQGQKIAYMGSTGNSTGPHLHFEIKQDGSFLNPLDYVVY